MRQSANSVKRKNKGFGKRLKELMSAFNKSSAGLGREIGVSHVTILNFRKGHPPKSEYLRRLANLFGVSTDWLLTGEGNVSVSSKPNPNVEQAYKDLMRDLDDLIELQRKGQKLWPAMTHDQTTKLDYLLTHPDYVTRENLAKMDLIVRLEYRRRSIGPS